MRIVDIRETAVPLKSDLKNSSFDFSEMTTSVVAVITDVVRDGKPVAGFAFNSTGRYACGAQMRERFIPRILRADPPRSSTRRGDNIDPASVVAAMIQREKIGGDAERSIGIGTIEVAVWDAVAKIADKPLHRVLAERYSGGPCPTSVLLCRRRLVLAGPDHQGSAGRDAPPSRRRLHHGQDEGRRPAARRGLPAHRGGARRCWAAGEPCGRRQRQVRARRGARLRQGAGAFGLRWFEEPCHPLDFALYAEIAAVYAAPLATGENLYSTQDVENLVRFGGLRADRDFIQVDPPQAYGIAQYAKTVAMLEGRGWSRASLFPHGGNQMSLAIAAGFGLGGAESYPGVFGAFGGFADDAAVENGSMTLSDRPGIGFEGQAALYGLMRGLVE